MSDKNGLPTGKHTLVEEGEAAVAAALNPPAEAAKSPAAAKPGPGSAPSGEADEAAKRRRGTQPPPSPT